jgi:F-type H+-transporting ATPase subunit delta
LAAKTLQAKRFSQAVFGIARERNEFDQWQKDLQRMAAMGQNAEFISVMENPKYSLPDKIRLLNDQLRGLKPLALNLAYILTGQNILSLVTDISAQYQSLLDEYRGIEKAEVITAVALDENEKAKLAQRLGEMTGKKVVISLKVDPDIIGGMVARVGGKIIDGSSKNQLAVLRNELVKAGSQV